MFDPNGPPKNLDKLFSLDCNVDNSDVIIVPVPFAATSSFRCVSHEAPKAILKASQQIDLYDPIYGEPWKRGIYMNGSGSNIYDLHKEAYSNMEVIRTKMYKNSDKYRKAAIESVNATCASMNNYVYGEVLSFLMRNKIVGILGGDHSVSFGAIEAASNLHTDLLVIQFDAHADLRKAYEGVEWSHASVMYNVLRTNVKGLIQLGIRDLCPEEFELEKKERIITVFDQLADWNNFLNIRVATSGPIGSRSLQSFIKDRNIWISCDIDGLDPSLCPNTGTPVPGGLTWKQFCKILSQISKLGNIVGFDLVEVGSEPWDANVGARALYQLSGAALNSKLKED